jgi:uncharacterized membrane protein
VEQAGKQSETLEKPAERNQPGTGRIEAFSDGVIAIIITIMVLNLKLPYGSDNALADNAFSTILPQLITYALSFLVVAVLWVNHHQLMPTAPVASRALMWWNNNLLFWMSLIPFVTNFFGEHPFSPVAAASYGTALALTIAAFMMLQRHIAMRTRAADDVSAMHRRISKRTTIAIALYLLGVACAFVFIYASLAIFVLTPALLFMPEALPKIEPEELEVK